MKLRIQGNSLRLRLNQSEVAQFSKTGFVEDSIQFGPGASFAYTLESSSSIPAPQASFQNGWLRDSGPRRGWRSIGSRTDRVGISGDQPLESGKRLSILIEKDFQCLHGGRAARPRRVSEPARRNRY